MAMCALGEFAVKSAALASVGLLAMAAVASVTRADIGTTTVNLGSLDGSNGFRINGDAGDRISVKNGLSAGDFNGDGFDDLAIGTSSGFAVVLLGRAGSVPTPLNLSSLAPSDGIKLVGEDADETGKRVSLRGDLNGDGLADLLMAATQFDANSQAGSGAVFVVFGKATGLPSEIAVSSLNGNNGFRIEGTIANHGTFHKLAYVGDVNGDGFDDAAIGSPADNSGAGGIFIVYGRASGYPARLKLSALNGSNGFKVEGASAGDQIGFTIGGCDVNGDGLGDVLAGKAGGGTQAFVLFGKSGSFPSRLNLSTINGSNGFRIVDTPAAIGTSKVIDCAGDISGDGLEDIVMGNYAVGPLSSGSAFVAFGRTNGASAIDVSQLTGANGFRITSVEDFSQLGYSVSTAGDFDGDGFADVMLGQTLADPGGVNNSGRTTVFFGKSSRFTSPQAVAALTVPTGFAVIGADVNSQSSQGLGSAGDFNGDGLSDILVGAPNSATNAGSVFVLFGREPENAVIRIGSAASQYMTGSFESDQILSGAGNDVLEGREDGDYLDGGIGNNTASYQHSGLAVIASLSNAAANTNDAAGDIYIGIQNLHGSRLADTLTGNGAANVMTGDFGDDTLKGENGNDRLIGGLGKDTQTGGGGNDTFALLRTNETGLGVNADVIADFKPGTASSAVDKIDVSGIDANEAKPGNQAFKFISTNAFSGKGQLRIKKTASGLIVQGNVRGSNSADFEVLLKGLTSTSAFTAKDFKL